MTHKEIKKDIHNKLTAALTELQTLLGDKKFSNRIKKAAKLLVEGIGKEPKPSPIAANAKPEPKAATPAKKASVKKAVKAPVKKTANPVAKKAVKAPVAKKKVVSKTK